jgi:hypothetical protein
MCGWVGQTISILDGGATGRGCPPNFEFRGSSPNHPQKLFQNMQLGIMNIQFIITLGSKEY